MITISDRNVMTGVVQYNLETTADLTELKTEPKYKTCSGGSTAVLSTASDFTVYYFNGKEWNEI